MKKNYRLILLIALALAASQIAFAKDILFQVKVPGTNNPISYNFTYQKGTPLQGTINLISQDPKSPVILHLSGVDALTNETGQLYFKNDADPQKALGQWITFPKSDITLAPLENQSVPFTINVPDNFSPGDYAGGISIQNITPAAPTAPQPGQAAGFSAKVSARIVKKVYVEIPGQVISDGDLKNFQYDGSNPNHKYFTFKITNSGNTLLDFNGNITIQGGFPTASQTTIPLKVGSLQGGASTDQKISWPNSDNLWGNYTAKLNVTIVEYNPITQTLKNLKTIDLQTSFQLIPWNYIFLALLILLILIFSIIFSIASKRAYLKGCEPYIIKAGDTLHSVADAHQMPWKKLAKINKLSPPYDLNPGSTILVRKIN